MVDTPDTQPSMADTTDSGEANTPDPIMPICDDYDSRPAHPSQSTMPGNDGEVNPRPRCKECIMNRCTIGRFDMARVGNKVSAQIPATPLTVLANRTARASLPSSRTALPKTQTRWSTTGSLTRTTRSTSARRPLRGRSPPSFVFTVTAPQLLPSGSCNLTMGRPSMKAAQLATSAGACAVAIPFASYSVVSPSTQGPPTARTSGPAKKLLARNSTRATKDSTISSVLVATFTPRRGTTNPMPNALLATPLSALTAASIRRARRSRSGSIKTIVSAEGLRVVSVVKSWLKKPLAESQCPLKANPVFHRMVSTLP
jgi:hypothetical protein